MGTLLLAACTRSDSDIARERRTLRTALAAIPTLPAVHIDTDHHDFDPGCHGFAECVDGNETPAVYAVPLQLGTAAGEELASQCTYFLALLSRHGIRLVTVWRGTQAAHAITSTPPPPFHSVRPRWVDVTSTVCASGHVHSAALVKQNGQSPAPTAHLILTLFDPDRFDPYDVGAPRYEAVADALDRHDDPAERVVGALPVDTGPLTRSEQAYLDAHLDQPFTIAADPPVDGISTDDDSSDTWTVPPDVHALRFTATCTIGDTVHISVSDAAVPNAPRGSSRTEDCTGQPLDIQFTMPATTVTIAVAVRERPPPTTPVPPLRHHPYVVQVTPG